MMEKVDINRTGKYTVKTELEGTLFTDTEGKRIFLADNRSYTVFDLQQVIRDTCLIGADVRISIVVEEKKEE